MNVRESGRATLRARFYGPNNRTGTRIRVTRFDNPAGAVDPNRITVAWDHGLNPQENYVRAFREYLTRAGWNGDWVSSMVSDGAIGVYVGAGDLGV
jgi:hypothetical protein